MRVRVFIMILMLLSLRSSAQADSLLTGVGQPIADSLDIEDGEVVYTENVITNTSAMKLFFEKLYLLEEQKAGKVNIVHIGDSHIQADLFTKRIRETLQKRFGNAGAGFTFPHRLARTNGGHYVRFTSNTEWESRRIIHPSNGIEIGLSGIALSSDTNFALELEVRDTDYTFNTIKIITPGNVPSFDVATAFKIISLESAAPKKIVHKIKSGEVLGTIAEKYNVTVGAIKKLNGLTNDKIRAGKTLKIPTEQKEVTPVKRSEFIPLGLTADSLCHYYHSEKALSKLYLLPGRDVKNHSLSGLVLEKDTPGILYHSIGVNGAKASDYNRYPLFFEQLPALQPDLVIISFGTNESFDKIPHEEFVQQLNLFIKNIKAKNPDAAIIVMTAPPSQLRKKYPNTYAGTYSKQVQMQESRMKYASWDLFSILGGTYSVKQSFAEGMITSDRVHYTKEGYEKQGNLFAEALLRAFENYKTNRK
ncbi:peptidoglycan-binding protein [Flavobacterium cyanobacteriorum]|uniref:Peptidoglycan-binding protein n=1 Tax=Flavobacterium cyanobacteriorum TaxID=2022802 RepID=A0A255Z896_9FLAO|nr:GDSL-type esterase/lipase family protein [Flavobacterium cyanobacteriorum]OYQ37652.1 peptidoglycan-binding protein [Flavobacterium cyanobacteriorum]